MKCIYCCKEKDNDAFSLEHVIPKFLYGHLVPDFLKTRHVCKQCNNNFGLFVDANFNKNWFVTNSLAMLHSKFHVSDRCTAYPLIYMGIVDISIPYMKDYEVSELWIGPNGEQIFWIKQYNKNFATYAGGNPRDTKSLESRAYFIYTQKTLESNEHLVAFSKSITKFFQKKKVKKFPCTHIDFFNTEGKKVFTSYNWDQPNAVDRERISHLLNTPLKNSHQVKFSTDINFSYRFMAKLALGVSFCLLGENGIQGDYAKELYSVLNEQNGTLEPNMKGYSNLFQDKSNTLFDKLFTNTGAITINIVVTGGELALTLDFGEINWCIKFAQITHINQLSESLKGYGNGFVIIIYPAINKCIFRNIIDYISYKTGTRVDAELNEINQKII